MSKTYDYTLVGAGIMSATLGVLLKELDPNASILILERLDKVAAESSNAWNNAGTGHAAYCELNYTPERADGSIDISKALRISEQFEVSKQLWSYLVESGKVSFESPFVNDVDHMSFVWGNENCEFLSKRFSALQNYAIFSGMQYSVDQHEVKDWVPLMIEGRSKAQRVSATRMPIGTDVNFGQITRSMIGYLESCDNVDVVLGAQVEDIEQSKDKSWEIEVLDLTTDRELEYKTKFVFIGAGGGALKLLEQSEIPEARGYGGFPVSGQFLKCNNSEVVLRHDAKVYGKADAGSPPMSVPHLDTRMLDGERSLLFGPYAGFSTKFLKNGSWLDLPLSLEVHNVWPMLSAGVHNLDLTKYLIDQVFQSPEERFEMLTKYYPKARFEDWDLITAGQRVQIIKKDDKEGGVLKFGTEIITNGDNSLAGLLGASPGASTAVSIMVNVLKTCFGTEIKSKTWEAKLKLMIPSYGESLIDNSELCSSTRDRTTRILCLS